MQNSPHIHIKERGGELFKTGSSDGKEDSASTGQENRKGGRIQVTKGVERVDGRNNPCP
jgi:hypothetical protein